MNTQNQSGKGFQPIENHSKAGSDSTSTASSGSEIAIEMVQIQRQVAAAIESQRNAIQRLQEEYEKAAQVLANEATRVIEDMLVGGPVHRQIQANLEQLLNAHPRAPKHPLPTSLTFERLQLKPYLQQSKNKVLEPGN